MARATLGIRIVRFYLPAGADAVAAKPNTEFPLGNQQFLHEREAQKVFCYATAVPFHDQQARSANLAKLEHRPTAQCSPEGRDSATPS